MTKSEIIDILNCSLNGIPVDFNTKLLPLVSEYLEETYPKQANGFIKLLVEKPNLISLVFPKMTAHYCYKHNICNITYKNKIILYF